MGGHHGVAPEFEATSERQRAEKFMFVVVWPPFRQAGPLIEGDGRIEDVMLFF
jgi:hypothetical protein